mmetsp:Transcript_3566/g.10121  ORF Transcript_3566/g.10121 Transcript_3566/m.10121 type:complete len:281 (+) Transcript_3566:742-1584(+)
MSRWAWHGPVDARGLARERTTQAAVQGLADAHGLPVDELPGAKAQVRINHEHAPRRSVHDKIGASHAREADVREEDAHGISSLGAVQRAGELRHAAGSSSEHRGTGHAAQQVPVDGHRVVRQRGPANKLLDRDEALVPGEGPEAMGGAGSVIALVHTTAGSVAVSLDDQGRTRCETLEGRTRETGAWNVHSPGRRYAEALCEAELGRLALQGRPVVLKGRGAPQHVNCTPQGAVDGAVALHAHPRAALRRVPHEGRQLVTRHDEGRLKGKYGGQKVVAVD